MAVGPVLGGWVIEHVSWRWAFFINLPLAVAVVLLSLRHVPESRSSQTGPLDWIGASLATASLGAVVTGLLGASKLGWWHPTVLGSLLGGVALSLIFLWIETHASAPMISLSLFRARSFLGSNLLTFLLYAAFGVFFYLFPMTLMQVHGYSATFAGAATLPVTLIIFLLSRWSGNLVARYGGKIPLLVGPVLIATAFVLLGTFIRNSHYWTAFFVPILVLGFGMALTVAPLTTVVMSSVTKDDSGAASGINNAVARVAGVLAIAVFGIVMVKAFAGSLDRELASLHLRPEIVQEIQVHRTELAGMELPQDLDVNDREVVRAAVSTAFLSVSRLVLLSCAILSVCSGLVALTVIPKKVT
jgi:MFS family permease